MSDLVIREADAGDIDAIAELEKICFATPWSRDSIRQELVENELAFYVVAELDGEVVGYMGTVSYTHLDVYKRQILFGRETGL